MPLLSDEKLEFYAMCLAAGRKVTDWPPNLPERDKVACRNFIKAMCVELVREMGLIPPGMDEHAPEETATKQADARRIYEDWKAQQAAKAQPN